MSETELVITIIRIIIGLNMVAFGLHQIISPKDWTKYMPEWVKRFMPIPPTLFLMLHGSVNLSLGFVFILGLYVEVVAWLVLAWWTFILPFAFYGKWQEGMRDLSIISALVGLVILLHF